MTAEIAILNTSGVALAADSAVTVGTENEPKVYQTANKLFALSKYHPVGIMVYGQASFMMVDWETIIKAYRATRGKAAFDTLHEYANDFLSYLENNRKLFDNNDQDTFIERIIRHEFVSLRDCVKKRLTLEIGQSGCVTATQVVQIVKESVQAYHVFRNSKDDLELIDGSALPPSVFSDIEKAIKPFAVRLKKAIFEDLPFDAADSQKVYEIASNGFFKQGTLSRGISGVVIAGYGTQEFLPTLEEIKIEGIFRNVLKFYDRKTTVVEKKNQAAIVPFAQSKMVHSFMEGVDPSYQDYIEKTLRKALDEYGSTLLDQLGLSDTVKKQHLQATSRANKDISDSTAKAMKKFRTQQFVMPVVSTVATLPKTELAAMAESLVKLTSFRQRVTPDTETVGGPIDVAIISHGDGFVWIKRKHYFKPELNPSFFRNYFQEAENGGQ